MMKHLRIFFAAALFCFGNALFAQDLKFQAVPFTEVHFDDAFWSPRLKTNREISIPHNYKWCEDTGRFSNFANAAKLLKGETHGDFKGIYFNDSDVYKVLEGTAYSLADHPDPELEKRADDVIAQIAAAQQPNGYLNSYYTLKEQDKKWTDFNRHELYCAGHLIEGAVAYKRATGKDSLLNVAEKFVDHIIDVFITNKTAKFGVPGHEEIELALVKLYQLTGKEKYLDLSKHFIDARGYKTLQPNKPDSLYYQDNKPIRELDEIDGHAVRAVYYFAGATDIAAYTGDKKLLDALDRLWDNTVNKKMYITGGIGARHEGEAFGEAYELPNRTAYCETCAAIGLVLWAQRMNLLHGDAKYADVVERAIYNGVLSGIGMDGKSFFYVNPLESTGNHHRQPFFDCACCPTNVVRFVPSLPGYVYATDEKGIVVNQFMRNTTTIKLPNADVSISMGSGNRLTGYPWDGDIQFSGEVKRHDPNDKKPIEMKLRIPAWCHYPDEKPGIKLYLGKSQTYTANGSLNSHPKYENIPYKIEKGYAVFNLPNESKFEFTYNIPFTYRRMVANPNVVADRGRIALTCGPIVYCFEEADNPDLNDRTALKKDMQWLDDIHGRIGGDIMGELGLNYPTTLRIKTNTGKELLAIPYFAWDSRNKPGKMTVWIRQEGLPKNLDLNDPMWKTPDGEPILYQPLPDDKHPYYPRNPISKPKNSLLQDNLEPEPEITASFCHSSDALGAVIDGIEPKNSIDHDVPRQTFWNHKGTAEWIEYDFGKTKKVSQSSIYWFDDTGKGECRVPKSWTLSYRDGDVWKPVKSTSAFGVEKDKYNTVEFESVETKALRIDTQLQDGVSGGVLEWKVN